MSHLGRRAIESTVIPRPDEHREQLLADLVARPPGRIAIIGPPRAGKTILALQLVARGPWLSARHTDDLIGQLDWSAASEHVAEVWLSEPGPWVVEGVAVVRALRRWLAVHPTGRPCDVVVCLERPRESWSKGQAAMAKGHASIWAGIEGELASRGVEIVREPVG